MTKTYIIDTDTLTEEEINNLSSNRREKAMRYSFSKDRNLSLAAGVALDIAIQEYGLREKDVLIEYNEHRKPYLKDHPHIHFNLSHSGKKALCVISDKEVGCDIEEIKEPYYDIVSRCFSNTEQKFLENAADKKEMFFRIWVAKESFLKAIGCGINDDMKRFSVLPKDDEIILIQDIDERSWKITEEKKDGYLFAICKEE